ncbi:MAG: hypothetical protein A3H96_16220 [Acidobacteria bacterium RIFCSPLOWO2_02_FULL_67_36]|nr:MAG: hypothetical protein A3H96_16220 [Acidobacteria bacterium RIFCSPLOWO2_02_FULL_67_36]OFW21263.1 MAG: hypothetical protein A3G21_11435 [Acidobacteria bacterium RIFCSPLOWO2_12_FULL_66_21]
MREGYRGAAYGKLSAMTTMLRRVALVVVLAASPSPSLAQGFGEVGTRAAGMGGAFVAVADDASAVYWNPAGLAFGSYVTLVGDRLAMRAGASGQARSSLFLGLGLPPLGVSYYRLRGVAVTAPGPTAGPLQDRNDAGTGDLRLDSLVTHNAGVTLVQSVVAGVAIGSTLRYVRGMAAGKFDADVGVMATRGHVKAGLTVRNLTAPAFETMEGDRLLKLQRQARVGIAVAVGPGWIVAADLDVGRTAGPLGPKVRESALGAEGHITKSVVVRGGVRRQSEQVSGSSAHSVGVGATYAVTSGFLVDTQITAGGDRAARSWGISGRFVLY